MQGLFKRPYLHMHMYLTQGEGPNLHQAPPTAAPPLHPPRQPPRATPPLPPHFLHATTVHCPLSPLTTAVVRATISINPLREHVHEERGRAARRRAARGGTHEAGEAWHAEGGSQQEREWRLQPLEVQARAGGRSDAPKEAT